MCDRCGEIGFGVHDFRLISRPGHRLLGGSWEGGYGEAAGEAIRKLNARIAGISSERGGLWKSPVVALSWNRPDGTFRYFAGIADEGAAGGLETLELPQMRFASAWHAAEDGDVLDHYARMLEWIAAQGLRRDLDAFAHREEYAPDTIASQPPELRIMLPVEGSGTGFPSATAA